MKKATIEILNENELILDSNTKGQYMVREYENNVEIGGMFYESLSQAERHVIKYQGENKVKIMIDLLKNFYDDFLYDFSPLLKRLRLTPKFIYQKITRGFSDNDLYNLDKNLAPIIHKRIQAFSKLNCGDYCSIPNDYQYITLWKRDLRKIEFAFEKLSDVNNDWLDADKYFQLIKDSDNSMHSEKWVKIVTVRREYIRKTLELFGRNFMHLWI